MTWRGHTLAAASLLACGLPEPTPLPRIVGTSPQGAGVAPETSAEVRFSEPVDPGGLADGRWITLVPAEALRSALEAVESDEGAVGLAGAVPASVAVEDAGRRVVLRPLAPLHAFFAYTLVLSSRVRAADGRPVLDADGRRRTFVSSFETGARAGPPPRPALTEVLADAATPEAGGEYVEIANLGDGSLDLAGWRLAKRTSTGTLVSCALSPHPGTEVPPGGLALAAGGAWDSRYLVPAGVPIVTCGATALLGGIANDRPPEILLAEPDGAVSATFGANGAPMCPAAIEKIDPGGSDEPANMQCSAGIGSPGAYSR